MYHDNYKVTQKALIAAAVCAFGSAGLLASDELSAFSAVLFMFAVGYSLYRAFVLLLLNFQDVRLFDVTVSEEEAKQLKRMFPDSPAESAIQQLIQRELRPPASR